MNANAQSPSRLDQLKWLLSWRFVAAGVVGNSYYAGESLLYRVLAIVAMAPRDWDCIDHAKGVAFLKCWERGPC